MVDDLFATWVECKSGMQGWNAWVECINIPVRPHRQVFFDRLYLFRVIAVFSPAYPLLNLHGQLRFTLDLYCAEELGLKGTKADLLEVLYVGSGPVLMEGKRRLTTCMV